MTEFHEVKAKAGTEGKGLSETASKHGSTRGRGYVTGSEFTAVLGLDCVFILKYFAEYSDFRVFSRCYRPPRTSYRDLTRHDAPAPEITHPPDEASFGGVVIVKLSDEECRFVPSTS